MLEGARKVNARLSERGLTMTAVETVLPEDVKAMMDKFAIAAKAKAGEKKIKVRMTLYDSANKQIWHDQVDGTPGMMSPIADGKAYAYLHGEKLLNPGQCYLMCCIMCPWCCKCKKGVNVMGTLGIKLAATMALASD